jgi:hypothetical protein
MNTNNLGLSQNTRKALAVHIGEAPSIEIVSLLQKLTAQIEELKRNKVSVTPVIPGPKRERSPLQSIDDESF